MDVTTFDEITNLIRQSAKRCVGKAGLTQDDASDVSQGLAASLLERLSKFDSELESKIAEAKKNKQVLIYVGVVNARGESKVGLRYYGIQ